jgi:hypothetical protein
MTPIVSALLADGWLALVSMLFWWRRKSQVAHGLALVDVRNR